MSQQEPKAETLEQPRKDRPCMTKDCDQNIGVHGARGYCSKHWRRWRKYGDVTKTQFILDGHSKLPLMSVYAGMKSRCYNQNDAAYKDYGGRGIKVCDRWLGLYGVSNFMTDMGAKPSRQYSIERIDNDGDYSPDNCRWATPYEQVHNKRIRYDNKSGYEGVFWLANRDKWQASIRVNRKMIYLGNYKNIEDAVKARLTAERKYWPEFDTIEKNLRERNLI
jgi:hypothetical protein